jgi:hypothetical protein
MRIDRREEPRLFRRPPGNEADSAQFEHDGWIVAHLR